MFKLYDSSKDGFIDLQELKYMMEKLGAPQVGCSSNLYHFLTAAAAHFSNLDPCCAESHVSITAGMI